MTDRLTGHERRIVAEARELSGRAPGEALQGAALAAHLTDAGITLGELDGLLYPIAYGHLVCVARDLAGLAERLGGEDQAAEDTRRLDRIRVVLDGFDREHDAALTLLAIERIVDGGQA